MQYRPDIDGLRAVAIATVVLFHLGVRWMPGGFVGVDIFFVISGFLITGLIIEHLREDRFSFWEFYARRTRRIYPALFVLIPFVLLFGYFILTPGEYENLGWSAIYSSAFLANVYFWLNTGYFDQSATTMPLLHLWSIGVEEQFYIIWPLTLVLVWRYLRMGAKATLIALVAVTILLAAVCVVWTEIDAKSAFFLPFTRLWEFTLGALALALPKMRVPWRADVLSVVGIAAMLYSAATFTERLDYPGYYAILPCLGATASIAAGQQSLMGRFLSLPPNVLLGKLSYSLYLWHWPIFVYYGYYAGDLPANKKLWLIVLALGISYLSWRFVEQPIRRRKGLPRRHVAVGATVAALAASLALVVVTNQGFPARLPEEVRSLGSEASMMRFDCTEQIKLGDGGKRCVVGVPWQTASKRAVLWGDSHAKHLLSLLDIAAREQGLSVAYWAGCPPFVGNEGSRREIRNRPDFAEDCAESRKKLFDWLATSPKLDLIILSNAWAQYPRRRQMGKQIANFDQHGALGVIKEALTETMAELKPELHPVLIIGDVPAPGFVVPNCALQAVAKLWRKPCKRYRAYFNERDHPVETILADMASDANHIYFLNTKKGMCDAPKGCSIRIGDEIIYRDGHHLRHDLSLATREQLISKTGLRQALSEALGQGPSATQAGIPSGSRPAQE